MKSTTDATNKVDLLAQLRKKILYHVKSGLILTLVAFTYGIFLLFNGTVGTKPSVIMSEWVIMSVAGCSAGLYFYMATRGFLSFVEEALKKK